MTTPTFIDKKEGERIDALDGRPVMLAFLRYKLSDAAELYEEAMRALEPYFLICEVKPRALMTGLEITLDHRLAHLTLLTESCGRIVDEIVYVSISEPFGFQSWMAVPTPEAQLSDGYLHDIHWTAVSRLAHSRGDALHEALSGFANGHISELDRMMVIRAMADAYITGRLRRNLVEAGWFSSKALKGLDGSSIRGMINVYLGLLICGHEEAQVARTVLRFNARTPAFHFHKDHPRRVIALCA